MLSQKELKEILNYDKETGEFTWRKKISDKVMIGKEAGCVDNKYGYRLIRIRYDLYRASRLAWLYVTGNEPKKGFDIDHINQKRNDDRIANLREVTRSVNMRNSTKRRDNKSGCTGVCWDKGRSKWRVTIMTDEKYKHVGYFENKEEAIKKRKSLEKENGYTTNHGN